MRLKSFKHFHYAARPVEIFNSMRDASKTSCLIGIEGVTPYQTCRDSICGAINDKSHFSDLELDNEFYHDNFR